MKIITLWHARFAVLLVLCFFTTPLIFTFSYLFEAVVQVPPLSLLWIALIGTGSVIIFSTTLLLLYRKSWVKVIEITYRKEYATVFLTTWLAIVGIFVMLNTFWQLTDYFFIIMIPLVTAGYYGLTKIGMLVFHVPLFLGSKD